MQCCLWPFTGHSWGPVPGKGTTFRLISCLWVRVTLLRLAQRSRLECETAPDYNKLPPSRSGCFASQLRAALFCQEEMTARFCSRDFLPCPGRRVDESAQRGRSTTPSFPPPSRLSFFPPLKSPLVIFPTHQPVTVPYVSGRSDLIGCVGVSGRSELCSFHTVSFWTSSSSTLQLPKETAEEEQLREGKKTGEGQKRNFSVHSL